jgi:type I restriction enzyme, S subunit
MSTKSWRKGKILDFFELQRGFDLTEKHAREGHIPVISSSGISYYHDEARVKGPGVITGRKGKVGNVIFFEGDFWPHDTSLWVKDFKGNYPKFIYHFLDGMKLERLDEASSVPTLNRNNVHKVLCQFPPIDEQIEITVIIDTWDKAIEETTQLIAAKEKFLHALHQKCFQPGTSMNRSWKFEKLSNLLKPRNEKDLPSKDLPLYSLTIENGVTAKTDRYNRDFLVKDIGSKTYKVVHFGDIVFNPANLRWGAIARSKIKGKVVISPIYEVLEIKDDLVDPDYLTHAITCLRQIGIFATKTEGTLIERMAVKLEAFLFLEILMPTTRDEQAKIAALLSAAKKEISLLKKQIDAYRKQKSGLMQKLLSGQWRIKVSAAEVAP